MPIASLQVSQSSDDGTQLGGGGAVSTTGTTLTVTGASDWIALGFRNITIPPGAIISAATLSVDVPSAVLDSPNFNIYAQLDANPATLTTAANSISSRSKTTSFVVWSEADIGTGLKSPDDLSEIIQEVVDEVGVNGGVMLLLDFQGGGSFRATSYDGNPALAATLSITYTGLEFVINSTITAHGVNASWERVPKRKNNDGTIEYQNYALHTWDVSQLSMDTFEDLQALQGQVLTSLKTTNINSRNGIATYANAEIIGAVNGKQEGRRILNCRITFRVDVS